MGRTRGSALIAGVTGVAVALGLALQCRVRSTPAPTPAPSASVGIAPSPPPPSSRKVQVRRQRLGGLDVTFLVASDTHLGFNDAADDGGASVRDAGSSPGSVEAINARQIAVMNALPGEPWPEALGGKVAEPRGVLITGDLTENGDAWQWDRFTHYYGRSGPEGLLRYPVFETYGNHDKHHSWYVLDRIRERHGGYRYSFDWDDLHLVALGEAPDGKDLQWLAADLASVGRARPVVVYLHLPLAGPYSEEGWFARGNFRDTLATILREHNVVALFHGHYHVSGRYRWQGIDVYKAGAARHDQHSFLVVHMSDHELKVAALQHERRRWQWWHRKAINGADGEPVAGGVTPTGGQLLRQVAP